MRLLFLLATLLVTNQASAEYLKAEISYTPHRMFEVTNLGDRNWSDCKFSTNYGIIDPGFYYRLGIIQAGHTVRFSPRDLRDQQGHRFNSFVQTADKVRIDCTLPEGHLGYYSAQSHD